MFDKILVALDGSELAERILPALEPLLLRPTSELLLVRVVRGGAAHDESEHEAALAYVRRMEVQLGAQGFRVGSNLLVGDDPATEIVTFAAKAGASLICISTHGRTGLRRVVLGSIAERVIRAADRPVLLVNPWVPNATVPFRRVVVPLDGSERAERALPIAAELTRHFGSELILVHVEELGALDPIVAVAEEHRRTVLMFERAKRALDDASARTVVRMGRPAEETLAAIRDESPNLVLMTTHGHTGLARVALGSVTEAVLRRAPCPVLVIRSVAALAAKPHEASSTA